MTLAARSRRALTAWVGSVALPLAAAAATDAPPRIVQQRLPDGSVVLTDRPQPGARIERSWAVTRDGAADAAAVQHREQAAREAAAVNERFARQFESEREHELDLLRQRADAAEAERRAAQARREAEEAQPPRAIVLARPPRLPPPRLPEVRLPQRPGPLHPQRPGASGKPRPQGMHDRPGA